VTKRERGREKRTLPLPNVELAVPGLIFPNPFPYPKAKVRRVELAVPGLVPSLVPGRPT